MAAASTQATTMATVEIILDIVNGRETIGENVDGWEK
jgi:hypothetical protein